MDFHRQETVAVLLGNMSSYPQWIGEWVRLKASPSVKIIRALLLDPAIAERLNRWASTDHDSCLLGTATYHADYIRRKSKANVHTRGWCTLSKGLVPVSEQLERAYCCYYFNQRKRQQTISPLSGRVNWNYFRSSVGGGSQGFGGFLIALSAAR